MLPPHRNAVTPPFGLPLMMEQAWKGRSYGVFGKETEGFLRQHEIEQG